MLVNSEQTVIDALTASWVWMPNWHDSKDAPNPNNPEESNTAGRIVRFSRSFHLPAADHASSGSGSDSVPSALLHFSADTRYKLLINGKRVAVGPARSSPWIWYYDTLDIGPYLQPGDNEIVFLVLRYFVTLRGAMPFARTPFPGLTVVGSVQSQSQPGPIDLGTLSPGWLARVDDSIRFPTGLIDDGFLHISERISPKPPGEELTPVRYNIRTANGELAPWRLRPRAIAVPEESHVSMNTIRKSDSTISAEEWSAYLSGESALTLPAASEHTLEIQADVHSTAFLEWKFRAIIDSAASSSKATPSQIHLKVVYSEGYEHEPRNYPFFRSKSDRLDAEHGYIIGPFDEVTLDLPSDGGVISYEPFWFRTLRVMRFHVSVSGPTPVELVSFDARQVNYPMGIKASWNNPNDKDSAAMWDVSIRTLRNCMFDGYVDCPFYEQLQYSGDSRSVGLFHYLLSGDDQLMRQAITSFGASILSEGLTQSRFPSHVPQIIAGFPLYWVMQICDHHLYFGDASFARSFLPRIDGVLDFFDQHVDTRGLVSGLPSDVWQYVDWVTTWGATNDHPDKGVPTAGRATNCHTFFSMLYAVVLRLAANLARDVGRPGHASEYDARANSLVAAVRAHCYDGRFFADTTVDALPDNDNAPTAYSQHCQVFAVLCGACGEDDRVRLLVEAFSAEAGRFSKCSYVMQFYALRAFALAGDDAYETFLWPRVWQPWRGMLANNLSTWEEDDVRQRSDCHAWGSVPIYEYCTELAGVQPLAAGASKILFKPRLRLTSCLDAKVCLGSNNVASVAWHVIGGKDNTDKAGSAANDSEISGNAGGDDKSTAISVAVPATISTTASATAPTPDLLGQTESSTVTYVITLKLENPVSVISILPGGNKVDHGLVAHVALTWRPE